MDVTTTKTEKARTQTPKPRPVIAWDDTCLDCDCGTSIAAHVDLGKRGQRCSTCGFTREDGQFCRAQWVRLTYANMLRADVFGELKARRDEDAKAFRERVEDLFGKRWNNCSGSSVRSFRGLRRRPRMDKHPQFFNDLAMYGRAQFDAKGKVVKASLGKGPTAPEFFDVTAAGSDGPRD